jgi:hypothetical protein
VLIAYGRRVIETDLLSRRRKGVTRLNFLQADWAWAAAIVTNPPYRHGTEFIRHARELGIGYSA